MEVILQIAGVCIVSALLVLFLKKSNPEAALLLALAAAAVALLFLTDSLRSVLDFLEELSTETGVSWELFVPLYKTVGIALVVKVAGNLCRDAGESALASVLETAGAVCALLVAMPLLQKVLSLLLELMSQ